eukprot:gnl/MRDRNA2_/MRDRNA2_324158_c0_seq1.p1 gnl/MRDRNA2_/MRDRNA2_324158_c0~~gnl/MRDRNA2_/MRDRNA2_324158_c0_seq1.p1  ORF type:complete len:206 (+),score=8.88 gnl/MRDRNA2_/MRDRNA2_324158_c0_seq1:43-660(+)
MAACYRQLIEPLQSRYSFVVRLRPDLMWYAHPPSVHTWNTNADSARALQYMGPDAITNEDRSQFYSSPTTCGTWVGEGRGCCGLATSVGCTRDCDMPELSSCQVVDDQFYIVPTRFANVVFRFEFDDLNPEIGPEWELTRYLMHHKVPFKVRGFKACLVYPINVTVRWDHCGSNWDFKGSPTPFHMDHAPPHNGFSALSRDSHNN